MGANAGLPPSAHLRARALRGGCRANAGRDGSPAMKLAANPNGRAPRAPDLGCRGRQVVPVELQEVVGGGDETPFRADGRPAPAFEASGATVLLDIGEDRLDHHLAARVELLAPGSLSLEAFLGVAKPCPP